MRNLLFLFVFVSVFLPSSAWALDCYKDSNVGPIRFSAMLPSFTIPENAPLGSKVWESGDVNLTVYCDNAADWSKYAPTETVHAWIKLPEINSSDVIDNPYFTFGVTYEGVDYETTGFGIDTGKCLDKSSNGHYIGHTPICNGVDYQKNVSFNARFRLYMKLKAIPASSDTVYDFGSINVLQFDGSGGANLQASAKNLRFNIDGLSNVHFLDCSVDIKVFPESQIVNFNKINNSSIRTSPATEPFSISTVKDMSAGCTQQFDVQTSFYTDDVLYDATHLDMDNGLLLKIIDEEDHAAIEYNQYKPFTTYIPGQGSDTITHEYTAELTKNPTKEVTVGPFSKDIIIKLNYH